MNQDLTGKRFGKLVALRVVGKTKGRHAIWLCRCECGNEKRIVRGNLMRSGSCGCVWKARIASGNTKHGKYYSPEYRVWASMIQRCSRKESPGFKNYGARGIDVCQRWRRFDNFYLDMGQRPQGMTLERKNNDLGYSPENCIWATRASQSRNTRRNRMFTIAGETKCLTDWAAWCGIHYATLTSRLKRGLTFEQAVSHPVIH